MEVQMIFNLSDRADMTARDRRNQWHMAIWWGLWVISLLVCGGLIESHRGDYPAVGWLALVPAAPAVLFLRAGAKLRRENDELVRKVHTEAAASGFVFGMLFGFSFYLLAPGFDVPARFYGAAFLGPMIWAYAVRFWAAARRFGGRSISRHGG
jgi:hypothetical protein